MTFEYKTIPVQKKEIDSSYKIDGFSKRKKTVIRKFKKDRRKDRGDRRSSIREGIIVSLSSKKRSNRRKGADRRKYQFAKLFA
jgi:hypothetical protein